MGHTHDGPVLTPATEQQAVDVGTAIPAQRSAGQEPASRQPASPPEPPDTPDGVRMCTCGHPQDMHEHYRAGHDCGACGPKLCPSFRDRGEPDGRLRRLLHRARRR